MCSPSTNIPYTYHNASGIDTGGAVPACAAPPVVEDDVEVSAFSDGSREGAGVISEGFVVSPGSASCSAARVSGIAAVVSMSDGEGEIQVVAVDTGSLTGSVTVRVTCGANGYGSVSVSAEFTARPLVVEVSGLGGAERAGAGLMSDVFVVSPGSASCSARRLFGVSASVSLSDNSGESREVSVTTAAVGSVTVQVQCTKVGYRAKTVSAVFNSTGGPVVISALSGGSRVGAGTMTGTFDVVPSWAHCVVWVPSGSTARMSDNSGSGREVSVTVAAAGTVAAGVECSAWGYSTASASLSFAAESPAVAIGSFDDASREGAGVVSEGFVVSPGAASCSAARVSGVAASVSMSDNASPSRVAAVDTGSVTGLVTVEVTCSHEGYTAASAAAGFTAWGDVVISGLDDAERAGAGLMSGVFAVSPGSASCSARRLRGVAASVSMSDNSGESREVSVTTAAAGSVTVQVQCTADGHRDDYESAVFNSTEQDVVITALSGGSRAGAGTMTGTFDVVPSWAHCVVSAPSGSTARMSDNSGSGREVSVTVAAAGTVAAGVECTASGYRAASASLSFTAVWVSGLDGAARDGAGTITEAFAVSPAAADCSASRLTARSCAGAAATTRVSWTRPAASSSRCLRARAIRVVCEPIRRSSAGASC